MISQQKLFVSKKDGGFYIQNITEGLHISTTKIETCTKVQLHTVHRTKQI